MILSNLPVQLTSFIGREREQAEIKHLVSTSRLLTLTGAGGCGKTRLALRVATDLLDHFEDGVWWIELAVLNDPSLFPQAVLQALRFPELPSRPPMDLLTDYFRSKHALFILDNCEHIVAACAEFVSQLLRTCPQLSLIVTSREALNIDGELAWIVPSLQIPTIQSSFTISDLGQYDAVRLFIARASAILPDFALTKQNADAVVRICQRLDGMPLAIELAAARIKVLQVEQIVERLDNALQLLTKGKRTAPSRHQTLRATMDWSYNLLSEAEKKLFQRLAVFAGGFTLEATEFVCAGEGVEPGDILDLVASLMSKSLLVLVERNGKADDLIEESLRSAGGPLRYRFLEPVRQYAHEKLVEAGEKTSLRDRHLSYFHDWTQTTESRLYTDEQLKQLANLDQDLDNIRAALQWALKTQPVMALHMVAALTLFWNVRGYTTEGRRWGEQALKQTEEDLTPDVQCARARALITVAFLTMTQGDYLATSDLIGQAIPMLRTQNDELGLARALFVHSTVMSFLGRPAVVRAAAEESREFGLKVNDPFTLSYGLGIMAGAMFRVDETMIAQRFRAEALANSRRFDSPVALALLLAGAGMGAFSQGDLEVARQYTEESLALFRQIGDKHRINMTASGLADILRQMSNMREAEKLYVEAIHGWGDYGQLGGIARCIECLAFIAIAEKRDEQATRWLGAAEAIREDSHTQMIPSEQEEYQSEMAILQSRMSPNDFSSSWSEGQMLTIQQVIAEVEQLPTAPQVKTHSPNELTPRELDVLHLLVQGLSDTQIAEKLVVSRRTVTTHLTTIYSKFGVNSRSAAIRRALDDKLI
jgi:predicted ATPase/DNA-binding CsgD family transcriptional regulator